MKNIFILFLLVLPFSSEAYAASLGDLQARELAKTANSAYVLPSAASLFNLKYTGDETTALVTISSAVMTLEAPTATTVYTIDFTYAAYDTVGELCDYLNTTDFECTLTGGKRDDSSVLTWDVTDQSVVGTTGYDVLIGTGAVIPVETIRYVNRLGITPAAGKAVSLKYCETEEDGSNTVLVYGKLQKRASTSDSDITLVASFPDAADTAETNGNIYGGVAWDFAKDAHVVISVGNGTTSQVDTTSHIFCAWEEK